MAGIRTASTQASSPAAIKLMRVATPTAAIANSTAATTNSTINEGTHTPGRTRLSGGRHMSEPMRTALPCQVHLTHQPTTHVNEIHHVWPKGEGGPDVPANRVVVCATGHNSIHSLLTAWLRSSGDPGWEVQRHYTREERRLARLGFERIQRQAL